MNPKVVFIDWDGTLSNSRFWERWSRSARHQDKYHLIQKVLFRDSPDLLQNWMCGWISHVHALDHVSRRTGIAYDELLEELRYSCEHMEFIDPELPNIIQGLRRRGIKVIIATDNMDTFRHWTIPALRLRDSFDGFLVSDTRGAMKAHFYEDGTSKFFNHYLGQSAIRPTETVLIDNSLDNQVVERIGMRFLHVNDESSLKNHLTRI